jgi:hypothetical protein
MPSRRCLLLATLAVAAHARVHAQTPAHAPAPAELAAEWPALVPRLQGRGQLRFLGLSVYDIALWAPAPVRTERLGLDPLALVIDYRRGLDGARIAERSLTEMRRAGPLADTDAARWLAEMKRLFPDVNDGDRLTGVVLPAQGVRFHLNGAPRGELRDERFAPLFFGIWLAAWTSEPALRRALLGTAP